MRNYYDWTPESISTLREMWGAGRTGTEIANKLGKISRNAVIGMAHRLKLERRRLPSEGKKNKKENNTGRVRQFTRPAKQKPEDRKKFIEASKAVAFSDKKKKLEHLEDKECRWPIGDPKDPDFHFCCAPAVKYPYCNNHRQVAYYKPRVFVADRPDDNNKSWIYQ